MRVLKNVSGLKGDVVGIDRDPACIGRSEAGDQAEQRRFAASRRPEDGEELAGCDVEVDGIDHHEIVEDPADTLELDGYAAG